MPIRRAVVRLAGEASLYFGTSALAALSPLLLLPVLSRFLDPVEFGRVVQIELVFAFAAPVIAFGAPAVVTTALFRPVDGSAASAPVSALVVPALLTLGTLIVGCGFLALWRPDPFLARYLPLVVLAAFCQAVAQVAIAEAQARHRLRAFAAIQVPAISTNIGLSLLLVLGGAGADGRVAGLLASQAVAALASLVTLRHAGLIGVRPVSGEVWSGARMGAPLVAHAVGAVVLMMSDRIVIGSMLGAAALGVYSSAYQVASSITMLHTTANQAWVPYFFNELANNSKAADWRIVVVARWYALALGFAYLGLVLVTPLVFDWMIDPRYAEAARIVPILGLAFLLNGIYKLFANTLFYERKTGVFGWLAPINVGLAAGLSILLVPRLGSIGASIGTLASMIVFTSVTYGLAQRVRPLPWFAAGADIPGPAK